MSAAIISSIVNTPSSVVEMIPTKFPMFPKLPCELRQMIWVLALPGTRIVEVDWSEQTQKWYCPIESAEKPCSHLSVCVESREVYLKYWKPIFPYIVATPPVPFGHLQQLSDNGSSSSSGHTQHNKNRNGPRYRVDGPRSQTRNGSQSKASVGIRNLPDSDTARRTHPHFTTAWREKNGRPVPSAYFNPDVDHVYLVGYQLETTSDHVKLSKLLAVPCLQQVKVIACHHNSVPALRAWQKDLLRLMMKFPRLEAFQIVHGDAAVITRIMSRMRMTQPDYEQSQYTLEPGVITLTETVVLENRELFLDFIAGLRQQMDNIKGEFNGRVLKVDGKRIARGGVIMVHK